jgi:putative transposase
MRHTFKYKLYRSKHSKRLHRQIHVGGAIHNHAISLHRRYYRRYKKHLSLYTLQAHLAKLKKLAKYAWWKQLGSQAIQDITQRIDKAYQRFFQNVKDRAAKKTTQRVGPPTFRKVRNAKSFTLKQAGWKLLEGNRLTIGGTVYKFAKSREIDGTVKTVTVKRDPLGDLYVYFSCLVEALPIVRVMTGKSAGFDFGLTTYLAGSDGTAHQAPQPFKYSLKNVAKANCRLSTKRKGSCNRRQARRHLDRVHKRVANQRQAFHWGLAHELCAEYDVIALETLNLKGMKALWGRKVSDLGFATFVETLHYVASKAGTIIQHIGKWFPSTKLCSACGGINQAITLRDRVWTCPDCGATHQRDFNAAVNIFREGASSHGGNLVSLASASLGC